MTGTQDGDLLTTDEQLIRHERWSETRDLPTAIRELAKLHHLDEDSGAIDESEDWAEFVDALVTMLGQLSQGKQV